MECNDCTMKAADRNMLVALGMCRAQWRHFHSSALHEPGFGDTSCSTGHPGYCMPESEN